MSKRGAALSEKRAVMPPSEKGGSAASVPRPAHNRVMKTRRRSALRGNPRIILSALKSAVSVRGIGLAAGLRLLLVDLVVALGGASRLALLRCALGAAGRAGGPGFGTR